MALRDMPMVPLLVLLEDTNVYDLIRHAASPADILIELSNLSLTGGLKFNHMWRVSKHSVTLKLEIMLKRNTEVNPFVNEDEEEEIDEDEEERLWFKDTISLTFNSRKFNKMREELERLQGGVLIAAEFFKEGNMIVTDLDWHLIRDIALYLVREFRGPLELSINGNGANRMAEILDHVARETRFTVFSMGYEEMNESNANRVLRAIPYVETFIFDKYKGTFETFRSQNFHTIIFNDCPYVTVNDLLGLGTRRIELINPPMLSEDLAFFVLQWWSSSDTTFEKLRFEYIGTGNPISLQDVASCNSNFVPNNLNNRESLIPFLDTNRVHDYAFIFSVQDSVDIIRNDGSVGTIAHFNGSTYFVVWHKDAEMVNQPNVIENINNFGIAI